jgi:hypothetical protein
MPDDNRALDRNSLQDVVQQPGLVFNVKPALIALAKTVTWSIDEDGSTSLRQSAEYLVGKIVMRAGIAMNKNYWPP